MASKKIGICSNRSYTTRAICMLVITMSLSIPSKAQPVSDMLERVIGGVVTVAVFKSEAVNRPLGYRGGKSLSEVAYEKSLDLEGSEGSGSGFLIEYKGKKYIITNAHVIEDVSEDDSSVFVFSINRSKYEVRVVGGDNFYDIAVLEFVTEPGSELSSLEFKKTEPRLGEPVYAIGNPLGEYPYSVSDGIIGGKNRVTKGSFKGKFGFLQTTATIIWGNSGGPLVDAEGKVAGINSQLAMAPSGEIQPQINFALEASLSERLVKEIIDNKGRVIRAYLGLEVSTMSTIAGGYTYPTDGRISISGVIPGSPAYPLLYAKVGAFVLAIDNEKILSLEHMMGLLEDVKPGANVSLLIEKDGKTETIKLKASELKTKQLEDIAIYVLKQSTPIRYDPFNPRVEFTYDPQAVFEIGDQKKPIRNSQSEGKRTFQVLAAGMVGQDNSDMYKVLVLRDLGAAIRLSALGGVLDFRVVRKDGDQSDVRTYRYYLSGDDTKCKSTLYY